MVAISPVRVDNVIDTTGAGDAFLGGLIVGMFVTDNYYCINSSMLIVSVLLYLVIALF